MRETERLSNNNATTSGPPLVSVAPAIDVLDAAAWGLVGRRCRQSYLHDLRGGMQALHNAVELLMRAANSAGGNTALADKASDLARRAMANHEKLLMEFVNQVTPQSETPSVVNVGELMSEVVRFVTNDAARKSITFRLQSVEEVRVCAEAHKFRLLILGLTATLIDILAPGAVVDVAVTRADANALIEFTSSMPCHSILDAEQVWQSPASSFEVLLAISRRWLASNHGLLELSTCGQLPGALRIHYPMAP
jgi:signal transduction histidine kinase